MSDISTARQQQQQHVSRHGPIKAVASPRPGSQGQRRDYSGSSSSSKSPSGKKRVAVGVPSSQSAYLIAQTRSDIKTLTSPRVMGSATADSTASLTSCSLLNLKLIKSSKNGMTKILNFSHDV
jgi:hypothetical protein